MEDTQFIEAVKNNTSYSDILRVFNKTINTTQIRWVKSQIKRLDLSISHFLTQSERTKQKWQNGIFKKKNWKKIPDEKFFSKDSLTYCTKTVKKRFFEKTQCEYKCSRCSISEWNGEPISLKLDHINGDPLDNRIENLRILCPNCHSQTPTFRCKRDMRKISYCPDCNKEISRGATECKKCKPEPKKENKVAILKLNSKYPEPKILEEEVKENGWRATGKKYGVSDNAIKKYLQKRGINIRFQKQTLVGPE